MFDNIGSKIKSLAMILFILGVIASFVFEIYFFLLEEGILGVCYWFLGLIASYLSALLLYGFGEIITKLTEIEKNTGANYKSQEHYTEDWTNSDSKKTSGYVNPENRTVICANCSCKQPATRTTCWHCGARLED